MHGHPLRDLFRNTLAVITGVLTAIAVLISLVSFLLFSEIILWSDTPSEGEGLSSAYISFGLALIISSIAGGYITAKMLKRQQWLYIGITTALIAIIFYLSREFNFGFSDMDRIFFAMLILPSALFGGYRGIKSKTKLLE
jgi:predicted MFS family arabinose efflux permease